MSSSSHLPVQSNWKDRLGFAFCLIFALCVGLYFHDKFYWGPDDGFFSYISQRMLAGDIVHKDIQALHPGLLYFINTAALSVTNGDVVSLRYPLIALTVIQTALVFKIALFRGRMTAIAASTAMIAFSFIQFINPSPNWYLIAMTIGLVAFMVSSDLQTNRTLVLIGAFVGVAFLFRQLTGVFLAMAVTVIVFLANSKANKDSRLNAGSIVLGLLAICLSIFVVKTAQFAGIALFGIFPILLLLSSSLRCNLNTRKVIGIISCLVAGSILVALPLIIYHLATSSLTGFIEETFVAPFTFFDAPLVEKASYFALIYHSVIDVFDGNILSFADIIFWLILLSSNVVLAAFVLKNVSASPSKPVCIGVIVLFHSMVALIYEIPIYLFYTVGLVFAALLLFDLKPKIRACFISVVLAVSGMAFVFHAAQPLDRSYEEIATGKRVDWNTHTLPKTNIKTNQVTAVFYGDIIDIVEKCTLPTDKLYAFPTHPEIYFLTNRKSAFKFLNSIFGIAPRTDTTDYLQSVKSTDQPALILHNLSDKHNTVNSDKFLAEIKHLYIRSGQIHGLTIYQRSGHKLASECQIDTVNQGGS